MPEKLQMFPLIIDKWIGGTRYMSLEEKGLYLELLIYLFTEQKPIKDSAHVARICGIDPRRSARLWPKIAEKFAVNQHGSTHLLVSKILNNAGRIKGLTNGAIRGGFPAQEKEKEYKEKNKQKKKENWQPPKGVNLNVWQEFEEHRKAINKPLTDQGRTKNANILKSLTERQQRESVDATIANRWTGLFPPKQNKPKSNGGGSAEDVARAYQSHFGRPPPVGKSVDEVRQLLAQSRDTQKQWWDA